MRKSKAIFLVTLCVMALCAGTIQPVKSQETNVISILSDGTLYSSTGIGAPIQKEENVYTFMDNLVGFSLVIEASNIILDGAGFTLSGDGEAGIEMVYANHVTIKDVKITGLYYYGISLMESSSNIIIGNTITGNDFGVYIYNSIQNTISGNTITNNIVGINMMASSDLMFRNNNLDNNQNLVVYGTTLSHFANDIDTSNTIGDKKIYYLINQKDLVISPDTYPDLGLLALVDCTNITVQDMQLTNNGQGIILAFSTDAKIIHNTIKGNHNGVLIFSSSNNQITSNIITNNYRAIQISKNSQNNKIITNNVTNSKEGILLFDSALNTFVGNIIQNSEIAIGFSLSSNNMIYGNYFINNTNQFYDASMDDSTKSISSNYWNFDYPVGGNYWSDYSGFDMKSGVDQDEEGSDNKGDTAYIIYETIKDNYPLLPYGSPLAVSISSPENRTYNTNSVLVEYTVSKIESVIGYSLDGQANITISGSTTLSDLSEGQHKLTVYAKDKDGNESSDTVYFMASEKADTPADTQQSEDLSTILIVAAIGALAVVGIVILYFLKIKKK